MEALTRLWTERHGGSIPLTRIASRFGEVCEPLVRYFTTTLFCVEYVDGGMRRYPDRVPREECPEKTLENVPDGMIREAMRSLHYEECPYCGERQWMNYVAGHNTTHDCRECGGTIDTLG